METSKYMLCLGLKELTQFELTAKLINNLQQFQITATAKLVLIYLTSCYNPKNADVFPKQATIAKTLGISERTVIRAVSELCKEGLILIECTNQNRYRFTEKIFAVNNLSHNKGQNDITQYDKTSHACIEQKTEQKTEPGKEEKKVPISLFEQIKRYASNKGIKYPCAYARKIIESGKAQEFVDKINAEEKGREDAKKRINETTIYINSLRELRKTSGAPSEETKKKAEYIKKKLKGLL